jgi:hypothetical protein
MARTPRDHGLEFILAFDGRIHRLASGHWLKFEIKRVAADASRPHGIAYAFTFHDPEGRRLIGYDNAHGVKAKGSRFRRRPIEHDHWHRAAGDAGRPYRFRDAATLLADFFDGVERYLEDHGLDSAVVEVKETKE